MAPQDAGAFVRVILRQVVTEYSPLQLEIKKLIKSSGPMPVWRYMKLCLTHPEHGYYVSRDPLGREGDFTTAPEGAQKFADFEAKVGLIKQAPTSWRELFWSGLGEKPGS